MAITAEPEVGRIYEGPVKSTTAFGAFVEIMPGVEGLLHITELQHGRTEKTEDVVKKGDIVKVKLLEVDERGRMRLSRKALLPEGVALVEHEFDSTKGCCRDHCAERAGRAHRSDAGRPFGAVGHLGPDRPAPTSRADRWASPTCSSTWSSRAPSARTAPRARPGARRRGAARWTPTPAASTPAIRRTCSTSDLPLAVDVLTDLVRRPLLRESRPGARAQGGARGDQRGRGHAGRPGLRSARRGALAGPPVRLLHPRHPRNACGALGATDLRALHRRGYYRGNCVIAAAGNVDHDQLLASLERDGLVRAARTGDAARPLAVAPARRGAGRSARTRDTAQTHIVFGTDTFRHGDPRRYRAGDPDRSCFGGGMSSRLFQRVREELGLAYAVYSYNSSIERRACSASTWAPSPETAARRSTRSARSCAGWPREGLTADELADGQAAAQGPDDAVAGEPERAHAPAGRHRCCTTSRTARWTRCSREIDAVTAEEVAAVAAEFFVPERQTVVRLGPESAER